MMMRDKRTGPRAGSSLDAAVEALRLGRPVILLDDADREDEGDLVLPATFASTSWIAFFSREVRGLVCVAMDGDSLDRLGIPLMTTDNRSQQATPFTVSVEAATVGTGISAAERAETIRVLADPASRPSDLVSPGHVFPLRAASRGLAERRGHTEGAVALCRLAGIEPAAVIAELLNADGSVRRGAQVEAFARLHGFEIVSIQQIVERVTGGERRSSSDVPPSGRTRAGDAADAPRLHRVAESRLPTRHGEFRVLAYPNGGEPHLALVLGDVSAGPPPLTRIHSECLTGDVLGSRRCDCGPQLDKALAAIAGEGRGVLLYLRQEGRGIGLTEKLRAYALQDAGLDTVDANLALGHVVDGRDYRVAGAILRDLRVRSVRLLTNNPAKVRGLRASGIRVAGRAPLLVPHDPLTQRYLEAKRDRLGHLLEAS